MDLVSSYDGVNLVSRCWDQPNDYPDPAAPTAYVKVYWRARAAGEAIKPWQEGPTVSPLSSGTIHYTPDVDKDVEFALMPFSAKGTPGFSSIEDAYAATLVFQRETDAPVIGLTANVTVDTAEIGITGFTRFARYRRLRVWADAGMVTLLREVLLDSNDYGDHYLPRNFTLTRDAGVLVREPAGGALLAEDGTTLEAETSSASLPDTVYVTVAHSSGNGWTPESNVLLITFASGDGSTVGSPGDFDPTPRDSYKLAAL
jgi:hypothetical protein